MNRFYISLAIVCAVSIIVFTAVSAASPSDGALLAQGERLAANGDIDGAVGAYKKVLLRRSGNADIETAAAEALTLLLPKDEALIYLRPVSGSPEIDALIADLSEAEAPALMPQFYRFKDADFARVFCDTVGIGENEFETRYLDDIFDIIILGNMAMAVNTVSRGSCGEATELLEAYESDRDEYDTTGKIKSFADLAAFPNLRYVYICDQPDAAIPKLDGAEVIRR